MSDDSRNLLAAERRARIAELVNKRGYVRVSELAETFDVSAVTIRNDLDSLSQQRLLVRKRGGAVADTHTSLTIAFDHRASLQQEEKRRIAQAAAELVEPGDTIIMDAGSTLMELAHALAHVSPLTVVTNALNVAIKMGSYPNVHVLLVGGSLNTETICTIGPNAIRDLSELVLHKVFLGVHAVRPSSGLTDTSIEIAQIKQAMIRSGRQIILLADSSKWGQVAFAKVAPLSAVDIFVTDSSLPESAREVLQRQGIELIVA